MCIINDNHVVVKNGGLVLWKVVKENNDIGLWRETSSMYGETNSFRVGELIAHDYIPSEENIPVPGAFHCFFTRKVARKYLKYRVNMGLWRGGVWVEQKLKIIKVYADSQNVVSVGTEKYSKLYAVSVSRMEIKSLKHQR